MRLLYVFIITMLLGVSQLYGQRRVVGCEVQHLDYKKKDVWEDYIIPVPGGKINFLLLDDSLEIDDAFEVENLIDVMKKIEYPIIAKEGRLKGKVMFRVNIDQSGNYLKHKLLKTPHTILTNAIEPHLKDLKFIPTCGLSNQAKDWVTVQFDFKLIY